MSRWQVREFTQETEAAGKTDMYDARGDPDRDGSHGITTDSTESGPPPLTRQQEPQPRQFATLGHILTATDVRSERDAYQHVASTLALRAT